MIDQTTYTRADIVSAARAMLETPYQHQGRLPGVALDCMGLVIAVSHQIGHACSFDYTAYSLEPDPDVTLPLLRRWLREIDITDANDGDVLFFRFGGHPQHLGIVSTVMDRPGIIHSYTSIGRVVEHLLDHAWRKRIVSAWRFPGIKDKGPAGAGLGAPD